MKKAILFGIIAVMILVMSFSVAAQPLWDITGKWRFNYYYNGMVYVHTMMIDSMDTATGEFQGYGYYNANNAYTWVIVDGVVDGDSIEFTLDYTGANPDYYVDATGIISSSTLMEGDATAPGQVATWDAVGLATPINRDEDGDGVDDSIDLCPEAYSDSPTDGLGTNRWIVDEGVWTTSQEKLKGKGKIQGDFLPDMDFTYGCSCEQILDSMSATLNADFGGHYKYGCSKSILEAWNAGEYYVGPTWIETVEVPANLATNTLSTSTLELGKDYFLKAYGTADAGDSIEFDAKYSFRTGSSLEWTDAVSTYESYGTELLDLYVDGMNVDWGDYSEEHIYQIPYAGTGNQAAFKIYDVYYPNNVGSLSVDIIEDKWVDLRYVHFFFFSFIFI
ncbi:hypothetical protein KY320_04215, partial [Candidatus Woesearchaeota archaeon]|nr:hypothetical protein [Candidatus Woesearchaeota archaeon]